MSGVNSGGIRSEPAPLVDTLARAPNKILEGSKT
jgi:hypothetical protein